MHNLCDMSVSRSHHHHLRISQSVRSAHSFGRGCVAWLGTERDRGCIFCSVVVWFNKNACQQTLHTLYSRHIGVQHSSIQRKPLLTRLYLWLLHDQKTYKKRFIVISQLILLNVNWKWIMNYWVWLCKVYQLVSKRGSESGLLKRSIKWVSTGTGSHSHVIDQRSTWATMSTNTCIYGPSNMHKLLFTGADMRRGRILNAVLHSSS